MREVSLFGVVRCIAGLALALGLMASLAGKAAAQALSTDEQAALVLAGARRAFQEGNYPIAADRFREFLKNHGNHKDGVNARFGLALALMEGPAKDYAGGIEALNAVAGVSDFVDRPFALYYLGAAYRAQGRLALIAAIAKPQEAAQQRQIAKQRFEQAVPQFMAAVTAFHARLKTPPVAAAQPPSANPPADDIAEWAICAGCDQGEMLLELGKFREALTLADQNLAQPTIAKSPFRERAVYQRGYAAFALADYLTAGRALGELAPFKDPVFGLHAQYLLGRIHHLNDDRPHASVQYEAVIASYEQQKKDAPKRLNEPAVRNNPTERARLEALVNGPPPDYVARATFYAGVISYEDRRFAEALVRFTAFPQQFRQHALLPEAQFWQGICQVQLKQYAEAVKNLQPYQDHPQLAYQALWWLGRSQVGAADPNNAGNYENAMKGAIELFRKAADKANQRVGQDPQAKLRRGDILLELADSQILIKQYREVAATCQQAVNENNNPERADECLERLATALHLAGQFAESDAVCAKFSQSYPRSPLLASVQFRSAENAYLTATASSNNPKLANREAELAKLFGEAVKRYQALVAKYPEFESVQLARQGLAMSLYALGRYEESAATFATIPESDRSGALSTVPYFVADCLLRTLPADTADALSAAKAGQDLDQAVKLLTSYLAAQPKSEQAADAMLKLGYCYQQSAGLVAEPKERGEALKNARQTYEKLLQQFPNHGLRPLAALERAKCLAEAGDLNGAAEDLKRFQADPLNKSSVAPLALVRLATIWRGQKKPAEAATMLAQARSQHEAALLADPARQGWVPALQYQHGLALKESGKLAEARTLFEGMVQKFAARPEASEAAWRAGQCRKEEATLKWEAARKTLAQSNAKPEEKASANAARDESLKMFRDAGQYLHNAAQQVAQKARGSDGHLHLVYETAWCYRFAGEIEIDQARQKLAEAALKKLTDAAPKNAPPVVRAPPIELAAVPLQVSEPLAREEYKLLIAAAPDVPMSLDARLELAEMLSERGEYPAAIALLNEASSKDLGPALAEKIVLRLGDCYLAQDKLPEAMSRFELLAKNDKSPLTAEVRYRTGECFMRQKEWSKAIDRLVAFRDLGPLQNLAGISDRALLRLGQAQAQLKQWDASRQTFEALVSRFPQSPWLDEGRFGLGWAWQNQNRHDQAVQAYSQVTSRTAAEVAARAQVQIGLARLDQKQYAEAAKALLLVPFTYDYPEVSALALCEASRAYLELKQPDEAAKVLDQVVRDYPQSRWTETAKERRKAVGN